MITNMALAVKLTTLMLALTQVIAGTDPEPSGKFINLCKDATVTSSSDS